METWSMKQEVEMYREQANVRDNIITNSHHLSQNVPASAMDRWLDTPSALC
jgi:hypothetical protein